MATNQDPNPTWMIWTGRVLTAVAGGMLLLSGCFKMLSSPQMVHDFTVKFGYPASALRGIGILELACALLYLVPRTATLGAILVAAYLGGATATHVRIGETAMAAAPVLLGVFAWAGLYLRDPRLRPLLPLR